jgi:hypothetical protein
LPACSGISTETYGAPITGFTLYSNRQIFADPSVLARHKRSGIRR